MSCVTIYLDMDGVLAKSLTDLDLYKEPDVFDMLGMIEGSKMGVEILHRICKMKGFRLNICSKTYTNNLKKHRRQMQGKISWLKANGIFHMFDEIFIGSSDWTKSLIVTDENDILIDDYGGNCRAWQDAGGTAIQFPEHKEKEWQTAKNWTELIFIVSGL